MKKFYSLSLLLVAGLSFGQTFDSFTGTGTLSTNGWTTHSGTADQLVILETTSDNGNSLSYTGFPASSGNRIAIASGQNEDVNKPLAEAATSVVYYSALVKVQNTEGLHDNAAVSGDYFLSVTETVGSSGVSGLYGRVYIKKGAGDNTVNFGILNSGGGSATPTYINVEYLVNITYLIVVKHTLENNTASMWVNPVLGQAEFAADVTNNTGTQSAAETIMGLAIRQGGTTTTGTGNIEIDEIRVSTAWEDVTPAATNSLNQNNIAGLKVYPNPLTGNVLNITSDNNADKTVAVYDVLGKQVLTAQVMNGTVNVSALTSGVYIVKVTEEGKTATKKLVVR
ncbi:T9SS type A sorting domain-containing protein [Flavobacterium coralii]|uniref:T9SS type A sorting domain-containing protein n=1 Tax=Flavobacterium coralii TaxID=2838017 RepID=UPI000C394C07|nr:hypothetical protein [Flavobacterium sp.]|tara:strand:+ start:5929 stop:6945 length:1017 start_codon:yes stop_codon:yes gene_type:complete